MAKYEWRASAKEGIAFGDADTAEQAEREITDYLSGKNALWSRITPGKMTAHQPDAVFKGPEYPHIHGKTWGEIAQQVNGYGDL